MTTYQLFDPLTTPEVDRKAELEATIERGMQTFVEVGLALMEIRDGRLYRAEYGTFEEYCRDRWGISRPRAYQLIDAAVVTTELSTIVDTLPATESQARPLAALEPEQQREAWERAVETAPNGKVTAAHVQTVVDEMRRTEDSEAPDSHYVLLGEFGTEERITVAADEEIAIVKRPSMDVHYSSDSPEWYTPAEIVALVQAVLGQIDLDPCSNVGKPNVPAVLHYTWVNDGLQQPWRGRVYMNPPYGRTIGSWVEKLAASYEAGQVSEAIALLPARTDTAWFRRLRPYLRCFIAGRLSFSEEGTAPFPSVAVYLGENERVFVQMFSGIGDVYQVVDL